MAITDAASMDAASWATVVVAKLKTQIAAKMIVTVLVTVSLLPDLFAVQ
jgi:hypothetical protein